MLVRSTSLININFAFWVLAKTTSKIMQSIFMILGLYELLHMNCIMIIM